MSDLAAKNTAGLPLEQLAAEINEEHRCCEEAFKSGVQHALRAGELLVQAKTQCSHGEWHRWLAENFEAPSARPRHT